MKLPKKPKLRSMSAIEEELWQLCRKLTFNIHGTDCYTCTQRNLISFNLHCGHAHPAGACGASMKYDLRILRPQCFSCNINNGGMGAVYLKNLQRDLGKKKADALILEAQSSKGKPVKARDHYMNLIVEYKQRLSTVLSAK